MNNPFIGDPFYLNKKLENINPNSYSVQLKIMEAIETLYNDYYVDYLPLYHSKGKHSLSTLCLIAGKELDSNLLYEEFNSRFYNLQRPSDEKLKEALIAAEIVLPPEKYDEFFNCWKMQEAGSSILKLFRFLQNKPENVSLVIYKRLLSMADNQKLKLPYSYITDVIVNHFPEKLNQLLCYPNEKFVKSLKISINAKENQKR